MLISDLKRIFPITLLLIIVLAVYSPARGADSLWVSYGLEGERIRTLAQPPGEPAIIYAGTEDGDIYKTTDSGKTWDLLNTVFSQAMILAIAVPSNMPNTVYVGTSIGLFRSVDGGKTWLDASSGITNTYVQALAIAPNRPMTLYAGTSGSGVFRSDDGGQSWSPVNIGLAQTNVQVVAVHPVKSLEVYVGTWGGGIYKSIDSGSTWNQVNLGLSNLKIRSLAIDPRNGEIVYVGTDTSSAGGVFRSTDGGKTWKLMNIGIPQSERLFFQSLVIDASGGVVYAGTNGGVFESLNNGEAWTAISSLSDQHEVLSLAQSSSENVLVYAGIDNGVIALTRGHSLEIVQQSPPTPVHADSQATDFKNLSQTESSAQKASVDLSSSHEAIQSKRVSRTVVSGKPGVVYAGTWGKGVFQYTEERDTWSPRNRGLTGSFIQALAVDPSDSTIIYAATADSGVFITRDKGMQWESINEGISTTTINTLAIDPSSPQTVYAGTDYGVFKTTNQGKSWRRTGMDMVDRQVHGLVINPDQSNTVFASTYGGIYKTTDGGNYWMFLYTGLEQADVEPLTLDPSDQSTIYAGFFRKGVYKSTDSGQDWFNVSIGLEDNTIQTLAVDPAEAGTIYAGTLNGIYKNTSSGGSWSHISRGLPDTTVQAIAIDTGVPATVYAGTLEGVYKSKDHGMTWLSCNSGIPYYTTVKALTIAPSGTVIIEKQHDQGKLASSTDISSLSQSERKDSSRKPADQVIGLPAKQQGRGPIKSGIIIDSFEPGSDSFSIIMSPCEGLGSETVDLYNKTIYVEVGPFFSGYLIGNLFEEQGRGFIYRSESGGKQEYRLVPQEEAILILAKDIELSGVKNPINVKVRVGDWICSSVADWKPGAMSNASKFQLP